MLWLILLRPKAMKNSKLQKFDKISKIGHNGWFWVCFDFVAKKKIQQNLTKIEWVVGLDFCHRNLLRIENLWKKLAKYSVAVGTEVLRSIMKKVAKLSLSAPSLVRWNASQTKDH